MYLVNDTKSKLKEESKPWVEKVGNQRTRTRKKKYTEMEVKLINYKLYVRF